MTRWQNIRTKLVDSGITLERVSSLTRSEELEEMLNIYTSIIHESCEHTIPKLKPWNGNPRPPWWKQLTVEEYVQAKENYKYSKLEGVLLDRESVWDGVYRVIRKTSRRRDDMLLRNSAGETLPPDQSAKLLAETFYPGDSVHAETEQQKSVRKITEDKTPAEIKDLSNDDPPFTRAELELVLSSLNPKKAPGKEDYTHPKSYRPIGLLPILGKVVEKLMVGRLQWWWPALKKQMVRKHCPRNLYALVASYLQDRRIKVNYARATSEKGTTKGCVQGSIDGPTFWNLILDSLLQKMATMGVHCQAFADDVILFFSNHHTSGLQATVESTLAAVPEWGVENKLSFAAHKTNAMLITKKLKFDAPVIHMSGIQRSLVTEIKLLGLILDSKSPLTHMWPLPVKKQKFTNN
ncbi:uncharacterized protein LOC135193878 [Vanessa tameamea]|uniref:Uncharacterized protein LOC135193878 n=1 Tax=Vanessa tameamea TaxID=334116 RepID=A0ABM4ASC9_VANTA